MFTKFRPQRPKKIKPNKCIYFNDINYWKQRCGSGSASQTNFKGSITNKMFFSVITNFNIDFILFVKNGFVICVFVCKMSHFVIFTNRNVIYKNRTVIYTNRTVFYTNRTVIYTNQTVIIYTNRTVIDTNWTVIYTNRTVVFTNRTFFLRLTSTENDIREKTMEIDLNG